MGKGIPEEQEARQGGGSAEDEPNEEGDGQGNGDHCGDRHLAQQVEHEEAVNEKNHRGGLPQGNKDAGESKVSAQAALGPVQWSSSLLK
jgi:hypothetical protein